MRTKGMAKRWHLQELCSTLKRDALLPIRYGRPVSRSVSLDSPLCRCVVELNLHAPFVAGCGVVEVTPARDLPSQGSPKNE